MGKLKIERLDKNDILYWVNIDELRMIYNQIRFGMELKDDGYGKKYEVGGVSQFINRKDLKSKSRTELEMLRISVREMMKKYYEKYLKLKRQKKISNKSKWEKNLKEVESYIRINENMILGKFLYSDIISNYLVKVDFDGMEVICFYKNDKGISNELLDFIRNTFLYSYNYNGYYGEERVDVYLSRFFNKGLVDSVEYKGKVHPFKWYLRKIKNGELLVNEIGEYKNKIVENYYPLLSIEEYDKLIYDYKNRKEGIFNFFG
jgi:hypothetical protein